MSNHSPKLFAKEDVGMPPKLVEDMTEEEHKNYLHWLNYCNKEGGCLVCDQLFCEQKIKKEHLRNFYNDLDRGENPQDI